MRKFIIVASLAGLAACTHTGDSAEVREITRSNAQQATADAARIAAGGESDPLSRAASCSAFLRMSINDPRPGSGYDRVAMEQAYSQWTLQLRGQLNQMETEQFLASTSAVLQYAAKPERDRASNYCVQNAPDPS